MTMIEIAEWATDMRSQNLSTRTINERLSMLDRAQRAGIDLLGADRDSLVRFLASNEKWKPATRRAYYSAFRAWYRWLRRTERRADDPTEHMTAPRVPRSRPHQIRNEDLDRVIATCSRRRTRAMLTLAAYQGLRAHEIAKMRGDHIYGDTLRVVGKGGVDVAIPLHPLVAALAAEFPAKDYWFPSYATPDKPISAKNVSTVVGQTLRRAGLDASAHTLRHWFGREMLRAGRGNLRVAQEALRHASPATTAIYTLIDQDDVRAAMHALPRPPAA